MSPRQAGISSIDEYIASHPPKIQAILKKIRTGIRKASPTAQETISYRMPAFTLNGILVYFAAFKHHIGLYPPNCGGEMLPRPRRPAPKIASYPASIDRIFKPEGCRGASSR